jgi:hypothetical protein
MNWLGMRLLHNIQLSGLSIKGRYKWHIKLRNQRKPPSKPHLRLLRLTSASKQSPRTQFYSVQDLLDINSLAGIPSSALLCNPHKHRLLCYVLASLKYPSWGLYRLGALVEADIFQKSLSAFPIPRYRR